MLIIRTLIVDDQQLLRDLMDMMLKSNDEIEVIGIASDGCQALDGRSTNEMAQELFLAEGRVRNIITEIISKLMLKDKTQLAVFL